MSEAVGSPQAGAKVAILDPETLSVVRSNVAKGAAEGVEDGESNPPAPELVDIVPTAEQMGVVQALREAAQTGESRHLKLDLVSTTRGIVCAAVSIHRLPDGSLLLISETSWQFAPGKRSR